MDTCQDSSSKIGDCMTYFHVCNHVDKGKLMYQCEAKDGASGYSEKADWHSSSEAACQDSVQKLYEKDMKCDGYGRYPCNCQVQDVDQATCHLQIAVCFYFKSEKDVEQGYLTYRGYAFDKDAPSDHEGKSDGKTDPQESGQAAADDLFEKSPDTAQKCGAAVRSAQFLRGVVAKSNVTALSDGSNFKPVKLF